MADTAPFRHADADASPGFLLWKVTALWQRRLAALLESFGITQTQYAILASLRWLEERQQPTTQTDLAQHAKLEKMTLSKAIRRLEADGLVRRTPSSSDGRATQVRLSAKGRKLTDAAIVAVEAADDAFFASYSAAELATYRESMIALIAANS